MPDEIIHVKAATIRYDNGDVLTVRRTEDGRYKWSLHREDEAPPDSPQKWTIIASNDSVSGVYNAMIGAAAMHHPGRRVKRQG